MKKTTALLSFILMSFIGYSQTGFQLGFHFSPNIGWFNPDSEGLENESAKIGYGFGLIADFNISENYAFTTGLNLLSTRGEINFQDNKEVNSTPTPGRTTSSMKINYVQIPVGLKLKTNQIGYMTYFANFGFGLGVNYDATADEEFTYPGNQSTLTNEEIDYADEIALLRASLMVGIGAEYNLSGNTSLVMGLSFDNGFTNVLTEDAYQIDANGNGIGSKNQDFKSINNFIVLNLGVIF